MPAYCNPVIPRPQAPVILTAPDKNPFLPHFLDKLCILGKEKEKIGMGFKDLVSTAGQAIAQKLPFPLEVFSRFRQIFRRVVQRRFPCRLRQSGYRPRLACRLNLPQELCVRAYQVPQAGAGKGEGFRKRFEHNQIGVVFQILFRSQL